jgi:putative DNA primase/helicase
MSKTYLKSDHFNGGGSQRIAATADQWDNDKWLLNTPGGTIDLRTGQLRPHDREDYITKITAVTPDPNCPTPLWKGHLKLVMAGDEELQAYLQRVAGYMLTGLTIEHAMFFLYGGGDNGKSKIIEAITGIMKDYHRPVPMEALLMSRNERHTTDIAGLRGARIASAVETGKGRNWDEPKIKQLTGGDRFPRDSCGKTTSTSIRISSY